MKPEPHAIVGLIREILARQGIAGAELADGSVLRDVGFQSLDFAELALRVEALAGREIDFDGLALRSIRTVGDIITFFGEAFRDHADQS